MELKVVGIIRPKADREQTETGNIYYSSDLMKHLINTEGIPDDPKDRIFLRGELKGMVLSRHLTQKVALCMGHTRTNVISQGYMYHLTQEDLKQNSSA